MDTPERTRAHLEMQKQNKTLDEQVEDLAKHFAKLVVDKDFDISNLNTSGKLRLECTKNRLSLTHKIDGIVLLWAMCAAYKG